MYANSVEDRKEFLARRRDEIETELAKLNSLPEEPRANVGGEPEVIWFTKSFGGSYKYVYAAVRADNGLWYTTGPKAPKGYTWADLIVWINDEEDGPVEVWWASEYAPA